MGYQATIAALYLCQISSAWISLILSVPAKFQRGKFFRFCREFRHSRKVGCGVRSITLFSFYFRLKNNEREPMPRFVGKADLKYVGRERSRDATILCVSRRKYNRIHCRWKGKEFAYGATICRGFFPRIKYRDTHFERYYVHITYGLSAGSHVLFKSRWIIKKNERESPLLYGLLIWNLS